ncbi:MAG: hypothetical protein COW01_16345 [Bdellovibrionales bacterium CG12_big_fil_rev_8_21_14_0_65_38_15]|nr:MAG: hypothetical protein COW79_00565 [Bdellovibrionales bacterium CG22_combo_CG10-13_8_21_14_all_38_13]PIQ52273.1 MAG: hypothetical protein COW01_16345 [Bdellovibrionales bacterium CG12_big_fil_rev_8_21_14_0_65_38_15]PIR29802.1 MAG: hypothetical protein COV38_08810 [Bdellovibrionales bacterium CG11_big_fil_rev_8_21_14_0_20_38_13]
MKTTKNHLNVLIIGGGLAGLSCAIKLSQMGHRVKLWEKDSTIKRKVCGEYLSPLGVECAKALGHEELFSGFEPIYGMNLTAPNNCLIETDFPKSYGLSLNRQEFENRLMAKALSMNIEIIRGEIIKEINPEGNGWIINGHHGDLLIGADGRQSLVAKTLKLQKKSSQKKVALHIYIKRQSDFQRRGEMIILGRAGYIGINPISENEDNLSWVGDQEVFKTWKNKDDLIKEMLKHPRLKKLYGSNPQYGEITSVAKVSQHVSGMVTHNAALIGDAAGFIDPLTGEGMTRAFESTLLLSHALENHQNLALSLKAYQREKKKVTNDKNRLNTIFQFIIKNTAISNFVGFFLAENRRRADIFIGIIGNVYTPLIGLKKMFLDTTPRSSL